MRAVHFQIGAGAGFERSGGGIVPDGLARRLGGRSAEVADLGPVGQLVAAIQMPRFGADRAGDLGLIVALLALIRIGDHVMDGRVVPGNIDGIGIDVERRFGLRAVPDVGQTRSILRWC